MKITGSNGMGSIEHCVSRMDTLAGIAIKYGVEIGDIKRMNSLVTDLQMFAHKKLQIPLPGRHPPSSSQNPSNGVQDPSCVAQSDVLPKFKTPQRTVSPAMSTLQGYYSLTTSTKKAHVAAAAAGEGTEMTVYRMRSTISPVSESPPGGGLSLGLGLGQKSASANGFASENSTMAADGEDSGAKVGKSDGRVKKSVRRRQKADADSSCRMPPDYLSSKEDNLENGGGTTPPRKTAKNPTPRKSRSRLDLDSANLFVTNHGGLFSIRKSSSTMNLQDSDGSSLWHTSNWAFKADTMARAAYPPRPKAALDLITNSLQKHTTY